MSSFVHQHTCKKKKDVSNIEDIDSSDDELDSILQYRYNQPSIFPVPPRKKTASKIVVVDFQPLILHREFVRKPLIMQLLQLRKKGRGKKTV